MVNVNSLGQKNFLSFLYTAPLILPLLIRNNNEFFYIHNISLLYGFSIFIFALILITILPKRKEIRYNVIDIVTLLYILYSILNEVLKKSLLVINDDSIIHISLILVFIAYRFSFAQIGDFNFFIKAAVCIGAIVGGLGLLEYLKLNKDSILFINVYFGNPNLLTGYLCVILPFSLYTLLFYPWKGNFIMCILGLVTVFSTFFLSFIMLSRMAIVVAGLQCSLFCAIKFIKQYKKKHTYILILIFLSLFSILSFAVKSDSSNGRKLIWKISLQVLKESPIIGVGKGKFKAEYNKFQSDYFSVNNSPYERNLADEIFTPFNEMLLMLIEQGIIGFVIFLTLILLIIMPQFTQKIKLLKMVSFTFTTSCIAVLLLGLTSYPLREVSISILFFVSLGVASAFSNSIYRQSMVSSVKLKIALLVGFSLVIVLCVNRVYFLRKWIFLSSIRTDEHTRLKHKLYLYPLLKENGKFLLDYANSLYIYGKFEKSLEIYKEASKQLFCIDTELGLANSYHKLRVSKLAEKHFISGCNIAPNRFRPKYQLFVFYRETNQIEKAEAIGKLILDMPIKIPSIEIEIIRDQIRSYFASKTVIHIQNVN